MNIEFSLRGLLNVLFRHFIKMFALTVLFTFIGLSYVMNIKSVYETNATLLVKFGEGALPDVNRDAPSEFSVNDRKEILQSYIKLALSRDFLVSAVEKIGADTLYPPERTENTRGVKSVSIVSNPNRVAVGRLVGGDLVVQRVGQGNILEFRVRNKDPEVAAHFADILIERFIEHQNKIYSVEDAGFLGEQVNSAQNDLFSAKQDFLSFKEKFSVSNLDKELDLLLKERTTLSELSFSAVTAAQRELEELLAQEAEMKVTYQPNSPLLRSIRDKISVMRRVIENKKRDLATEDGTLSLQLSKIEDRISVLEQNRPEYDKLQQAVLARESDYNYYKRKSEDARINEMLRNQNITRITIIERPIVPTSPISTRKKLLFLGFIFLGGFLGLALSLVIEIFDDRVLGVEAVRQATKVPMLACFDRKDRSIV